MPTFYTCPYSEGSCVDGTGINYFWEVTSKSFYEFDQYTILYEGIRLKIQDSNNPTIYFVNTSSNVRFSLSKHRAQSLRGYVTVAKEHIRRFISGTTQNNDSTSRLFSIVEDIL